MADRKVLVKYYPPDFDPEKLAQKGRLYRNYDAKRRKGQVKLMNVRFMFPFTMCCATCNEFIYIGTKFNSRVERIKGEDYLGIPIWRFYARCPHCRADIMFKTDPQNTEYVLESGGTRTYDQRKDAALAEMSLKEQLEEELTDSMRALEHKTHNTANELVALEQLDELRKINKRLLNRESTLDEAMSWLLKGGVEQQHLNATSEELNQEDVADLERAKEEMEELKLKKTAAMESVTEEDSTNDKTSSQPLSDTSRHRVFEGCEEKPASSSSITEDAITPLSRQPQRQAFRVIRKIKTSSSVVEAMDCHGKHRVVDSCSLLNGYDTCSSASP